MLKENFYFISIVQISYSEGYKAEITKLLGILERLGGRSPPVSNEFPIAVPAVCWGDRGCDPVGLAPNILT